MRSCPSGTSHCFPPPAPKATKNERRSVALSHSGGPRTAAPLRAQKQKQAPPAATRRSARRSVDGGRGCGRGCGRRLICSRAAWAAEAAEQQKQQIGLGQKAEGPLVVFPGLHGLQPPLTGVGGHIKRFLQGPLCTVSDRILSGTSIRFAIVAQYSGSL